SRCEGGGGGVERGRDGPVGWTRGEVPGGQEATWGVEGCDGERGGARAVGAVLARSWVRHCSRERRSVRTREPWRHRGQRSVRRARPERLGSGLPFGVNRS